ncbi:hypothetical protein [Nannocystis radixulma]|uniref:Uncharacterized protein n=1 Tax=Nannocystis radixulma TaxID=2995305 RepID=A0ABT5BAV2_9BACT|nr:hypothetical protein [Nannocystis radixulma]MDC0670634.1 hypothetical protein [Nannocystis radixulma]
MLQWSRLYRSRLSASISAGWVKCISVESPGSRKTSRPAHLRDHGPEVPGVGPSDAQVLARITRLGELVAATPWSTMFPPPLTGDDRWIDDIDVVATRLPALRTFAVELDRGAAGTRLILRLDGHEVVPPWPPREVAWIAALGRVPPGSVVLTWQTWLTVQRGGERWEHAALELPGEGTMLCAVWWRQISSPEHGDPEQVLGFRVPLQLWDEAFAAATASLDR